jgi:hypothetical protein
LVEDKHYKVTSLIDCLSNLEAPRPPLFIICVSDIPNLNRGKVIMNTDDTSILNTGIHPKELKIATRQLTQCFESNSLNTYLNKINYILFQTQ